MGKPTHFWLFFEGPCLGSDALILVSKLADAPKAQGKVDKTLAVYVDLSGISKIFYDHNDLTFLKIILKILFKDERDRSVASPKDVCMFERHLVGGIVCTSPVVLVAKQRQIR